MKRSHPSTPPLTYKRIDISLIGVPIIIEIKCQSFCLVSGFDVSMLHLGSNIKKVSSIRKVRRREINYLPFCIPL